MRSLLSSLCLLVLVGVARADAPVDRLAAAVRFETVSPEEPATLEPAPFLAFHDFLAESFPTVHQALAREVVADYSLLFRWEGREPERAPVLLTAHFDVVPVPEEQLAEWTQPPFAGAIADGYVWGRGTLDDKVGVMGMLEAAERLAREGFAPRVPVYFAFGHDEEVGGPAGAAAITELLRERGVRLEFTLDEGMVIGSGELVGVNGWVGLIGIAEKGFLTLDLTAHAEGGHSSTPSRTTAIGRLARAIQRVEQRPLPARIDGASAAMFDALAPRMPASRRLLISQRWLFGGLLERRLSQRRATNAMIRTTTAVTVVRGGVKANVLPPTARAAINFRLLPGDSLEFVEQFVKDAIDDSEITVERRPPFREASRVSDVDSDSYRLLVETLAETHPEVLPVPALVVGGTDTKHYGQLAEQSFRFTPMHLEVEDLPRVHGLDERLGVEDYGRVIEFYEALLRKL
ncbi:MAG: M20 family peptidase [Myxococcota bacterium]|nr:M20 family peptidase [Myxococcota bacterium]